MACTPVTSVDATGDAIVIDTSITSNAPVPEDANSSPIGDVYIYDTFDFNTYPYSDPTTEYYGNTGGTWTYLCPAGSSPTHSDQSAEIAFPADQFIVLGSQAAADAAAQAAGAQIASSELMCSNLSGPGITNGFSSADQNTTATCPGGSYQPASAVIDQEANSMDFEPKANFTDLLGNTVTSDPNLLSTWLGSLAFDGVNLLTLDSTFDLILSNTVGGAPIDTAENFKFELTLWVYNFDESLWVQLYILTTSFTIPDGTVPTTTVPVNFNYSATFIPSDYGGGGNAFDGSQPGVYSFGVTGRIYTNDFDMPVCTSDGDPSYPHSLPTGVDNDYMSLDVGGGGPSEYIDVPAGSYTSPISQDTADNLAIAQLNNLVSEWQALNC